MKIKVRLGDTTGAVKELEGYKRKAADIGAALAKRLAEIGAQEASIRFTTAIYDGANDVEVSAEPTATGWKIVARGQAVCFIEFGSGVYHNSSEPYPNPRPSGIVGIGEYGQGKGKRQGWGYYDESGKLVLTKGNPAAMPLYYASQEMQRQVVKIAREVLS